MLPLMVHAPTPNQVHPDHYPFHRFHAKTSAPAIFDPDCYEIHTGDRGKILFVNDLHYLHTGHEGVQLQKLIERLIVSTEKRMILK
jgi:fructosamine-3-kinase